MLTFRLIVSLFLVLAAGMLWADEQSNDNLELVQSTYSPQIENLFSALAPDVEWIETAGGPYGGTYIGLEEIRANVFAHFGGDWEGFHPEPDNFVVQGDTVVVTGTYLGKYKLTEKEVSARFTHVFQLEDGKIIRFEQFTDTHALQEATEP